MSTVDKIAVILITLGAGVMLLSVVKTRRVVEIVPRGNQRKRWQTLWGLMSLFVCGYLATILFLAFPVHHGLLELATGTVFLLGALFVYLVVLSGHETMKALDARLDEVHSAHARLEQEMVERQHVEVELRHAQKLEAIGQLAAGIAHEINTPIQYVSDGVSFLKNSFGSLMDLVSTQKGAINTLAGVHGGERLLKDARDAEVTADLQYLEEHVPGAFERTLDGVSRVSAIVRAMREFGYAGPQQRRAADLNRALSNTLTICRNQYKYVADVETELGALPPVLCHPEDLGQVFVNLIVNAAHAIQEVVGDTGQRGLIQVRSGREGDTVVISIRDTGRGIPPEIRGRIFDPFFTTKDVGKGTGQGLAIVHSVIAGKHQGSSACESEVGQGTTFTIRLPVGGADAGQEEARP